VKPKNSRDDHVDGRGQVNTSRNVTELMGEYGIQLARTQAIHDSSGQGEDRAKQSNNAGFQQASRSSHFDRCRNLQLSAGPHSGADAEPAGTSASKIA